MNVLRIFSAFPAIAALAVYTTIAVGLLAISSQNANADIKSATVDVNILITKYQRNQSFYPRIRRIKNDY